MSSQDVLYLSLVIDNADFDTESTKISSIWNPRYHFYLSEQDQDLIWEQSSKLLSHSEIPVKWAEISYSAIKFLPRTAAMDPDDWVAEFIEQFPSVGEKQTVTRRPLSAEFQSYLPLFGEFYFRCPCTASTRPRGMCLFLLQPVLVKLFSIQFSSWIAFGIVVGQLMNWSIEAIVYQLEEEETEIWKNIPAAAVESCR
ncbi:hypothetical protein BKA61DRAFT_668861 [Leptodontidium sp. MPI-SDFR-AT-0119]|nr:hypothetical protein BKA61DRAFT_668861 [Leptodontidium sp. MPI-SDFR-AT-0119]